MSEPLDSFTKKQLDDYIKRLQAENKDLIYEAKVLNKNVKIQSEILMERDTTISKLRDCVEFYGDQSEDGFWEYISTDKFTMKLKKSNCCKLDLGKRARQCLQELDK